MIGCLLGLVACQPSLPHIDEQKEITPVIYPDYKEVTIPVNVAPLNFGLRDAVEDAVAVFSFQEHSISVWLKDSTFQIPLKAWKELLQQAKGKSLEVSVSVKEEGKWMGYKAFDIYVASEPMDAYLAYRKIAPGYELWKNMGIYQRNLETFDESPVL